MGQLELNRAIFDAQRYERKNTVTAEQMRTFQRQQQLERSRMDPPKNEIWSAKALNELLQDVQVMSSDGTRGPDVRLDEDVVKHLGVSSGTINGSVTMLQSLPLAWPLVLQDRRFDKERNAIDKLLPDAVRYAGMGRIDATVYNGLTNNLNDLKDRVKEVMTTLSPSDHIRAKRYLNQLEDSLNALRDPSVANFFNGKWEAKGSTVAEVLDNMTRSGLTFAPAAEGNETYYQAFYSALRSYDLGLFRQVGNQTPPQK